MGTNMSRGESLMEDIVKQLTYINNKLFDPFPQKDVQKLQEDFHAEFLKLSDEENCLSGDFHSFCMNIAGSLSYILAGKRIPQNQVELLRFSFF
jgi:SAM-dependent MidA family methyltransferase